MNKIIESFLRTHIEEYGLGDMEKEVSFEHFVNRCIINKYAADRFDPSDIMTDPGEKGLDGVAIIVNDRLILDSNDLLSVLQDYEVLNVTFIFIQSKTSENFCGSEIGDFIYGVKAFFEDSSARPQTNEKMERLISIKDKIYEESIHFKEAPKVDLYYVCCGKWNEDNGLQDRINIDLKPLTASTNYSKVNFYPYDSEKIVITYKELKKKVSKSFQMDKRMIFPAIDGVKQAFMGIVKCKDFVNILTDSDGKMLTNIFEDNVRDFQGYNIVNSEIQDTISNPEDQNRFALLNNGITIVAKSIKSTGDTIELFDYQIVNGCQTSYVLFDNASKLTDESYIVLKIIEVSDEQIAERVIFTTNRQTEVKAEAFTSTKPFHKKLQDFYNAIESPYGLFYERRSKQYDLNDGIVKNRIVTLAMQTSSYLAVFLNEPHSTHRYYGELLKTYKNKLYLANDCPDIYYISAYLVFYLDEAFRAGKIPSKYKPFKYHLACAIKSLEVGSRVISGQNRKQKKEFEKLYALIKNNVKLEQYTRSVVSCLNETLEHYSNVPNDERYRNRDITKDLLSRVASLLQAAGDKEFLKIGDIVHCVVSSMNSSFLYVTLKTEDLRNYGSIHISNVTGQYIVNLADEVSISDTFQAKIIKDFDDSEFGWELTRIY